MSMQDKPSRRSAHPWLRLALIETAVLAVGGLALLAFVAMIDERTRALLPFIPH
jgi:hypothetical protein